MGPYEVPDWAGLSGVKRAQIEDETGLRAQIRYRSQWQGKGLTLSGPPGQLGEALESVKRLLRLFRVLNSRFKGLRPEL